MRYGVLAAWANAGYPFGTTIWKSSNREREEIWEAKATSVGLVLDFIQYIV